MVILEHTMSLYQDKNVREAVVDHTKNHLEIMLDITIPQLK